MPSEAKNRRRFRPIRTGTEGRNQHGGAVVLPGRKARSPARNSLRRNATAVGSANPGPAPDGGTGTGPVSAGYFGASGDAAFAFVACSARRRSASSRIRCADDFIGAQPNQCM